MKLYIVLDEENQFKGITASKFLAKAYEKAAKEHELKRTIYEMEIKTQGKNFHTWGEYTTNEIL